VRIKILGKIWKFRRVPPIRDGKDWGACDPPFKLGKSIRIARSAKGEIELDTLLHEMLHAADWTKDEEWVAEAARDIARVLCRLGYRRNEEK